MGLGKGSHGWSNPNGITGERCNDIKFTAQKETFDMTEMEAIELGREFFYHAVLLTGPALVISLVVGLIISIFQAVTNIQEQTLSFAPRILALAGLFVVTMPWLLQMTIYFTVQMFSRAASAGH